MAPNLLCSSDAIGIASMLAHDPLSFHDPMAFRSFGIYRKPPLTKAQRKRRHRNKSARKSRARNRRP